MRALRNGVPHYYLKPGEMYCGDTPTMVSTLLGSCVSVTLFSPTLKIGAICHGLLPNCRERASCRCTMPCVEGSRYVECSVRHMLGWFRQVQIAPPELEAKVFGGANMFDTSSGKNGKILTVGRQNIEIARLLLKDEGVRVLASDVGGERGRRLYFFTSTGDVYLRRFIKRSNP